MRKRIADGLLGLALFVAMIAGGASFGLLAQASMTR